MMAPPDPVTLERFTPLVGQAFRIGTGADGVDAVLVEANSLREAQGAGARSHQFSLVWRGPPGAVLPQQIHTVSHPLLGTLDLFLVPIGPDTEGMRYQAVFT